MIVESIRPVTKKRSAVCVEGQPVIVLYNGELSRYHICENGEISEAVWEEITVVLIRRSRKRALNLLLKSDRTRKQLMEKLNADGYPEPIAEQAVAYAESFGYINDYRYAERYLNGPGARKSRTVIRMELMRKGVDAELIEKVLAEQEGMPEQEEREKARQLARKRLGPSHLLDRKEYRRAYGYLARRGFAASDILAVLEEYQHRDDTTENV